MTIYRSINPATEKLIAEYDVISENELEKSLSNAHIAQKEWKKTTINERLKLVIKLREVLALNKTKLSKIITAEMGKTLLDADKEVSRLDLYCTHALERFEQIVKSKDIENPIAKAKLEFDPLGIILAITPWNVPVATPFRIAFPAVLTGNAVLIKPAPNVAGSAITLSQLFLEAGFPNNLVQVVTASNEQAENLIKHKLIKKIAFVGSTQVGKHLASIAGANIKPILLELGGSDPFIVLKDANIEQAAIDAAAARCTNAGQVCCASKRMIIENSVYEQFKDKFVSSMKTKVCGNPQEEKTSYGPIARKDLFEKLIAQVDQAKKSGANVLLDGGKQNNEGYYFDPVVFEESKDTGYSTDEEFFGPVATLYRAKDAKHAIEIANSSQYGLGSAVYTSNMELAHFVARELDNGFVYINKPPGLNPYVPFGGVKQSGFGKDCGDEGYYEYVNKKAIIS